MNKIFFLFFILLALILPGCDDGPDGACIGRTNLGLRACANESEGDCNFRANNNIGGTGWVFYPGDTCADHGIQ